jgi:hypothetical protein
VSLRPTGRHRRPRAVALFRPAEVNDLAYCPAEQQITMHAFKGRTRICWTCRRESPTAVPRG